MFLNNSFADNPSVPPYNSLSQFTLFPVCIFLALSSLSLNLLTGLVQKCEDEEEKSEKKSRKEKKEEERKSRKYASQRKEEEKIKFKILV